MGSMISSTRSSAAAWSFIARTAMQRVRRLLGPHFALVELPSAALAEELTPAFRPVAPA